MESDGRTVDCECELRREAVEPAVDGGGRAVELDDRRELLLILEPAYDDGGGWCDRELPA